MFHSLVCDWAVYSNQDESQLLVSFSEQELEIPAIPGNAHYDAVMRQVDANELVIGKFTPPEKPKRRVGTPRDFLRLFTREERLAFWTAEKESPLLRDWWAEASTGDFSLDHPTVEPGLSLLVAAEILTEERKAAILATDFNQVN